MELRGLPHPRATPPRPQTPCESVINSGQSGGCLGRLSLPAASRREFLFFLPALEGFLHRAGEWLWGRCRGICFLASTHHTTFLFPRPGCRPFEGRDSTLSLHLLVQVLSLRIPGTRFMLGKLMSSITAQIHVWASASQAPVPSLQIDLESFLVFR